jgi:beta-glucosidase
MELPSLNSLTLKEKIGQMIVVRASGHLFDHQRRYPVWEATNSQLQFWLTELKIGGVILLGGSAAEISIRTQKLQNLTNIPLFFAADIEEGVGQRFAGATWFPPPMNLGEIAKKDLTNAGEYAKKMGAITAQEALAIGINWILAPIVDVNNCPDNPVINVRSFGETPEIVAQLGSAFIKGTQSYPILTTAKHFPGHGDTATDSHLDLPVIPHDTDRLAKVELPPFQQAIDAGVDSVMTAHLIIPAWDKQRPATLSQTILTGQLREKLGFQGLIVTDALIMAGVANYASLTEISVMAIEAGADLLLMPENPEIALNSVYEAVLAGRISEARIDESLGRIWQAKEKIKQPALNLEAIAQPESLNTAVEIIKKGVQTSLNLPVNVAKIAKKPVNLILIDDLLKTDFLSPSCPSIVIPQKIGYQGQIREQNQLPDNLGEIGLLQLFTRGNPFRGTAGLSKNTQDWLKNLLENHEIEGLVVYGSPYMWTWLKEEIKVEPPAVFTFGQMDIAQTIALEILFGVSRFNDLKEKEFL